MIAGFEVPHVHMHVVPISTMAHLDFSSAKSRCLTVVGFPGEAHEGLKLVGL